MKINKQKLKQLLLEEIQNVLQEEYTPREKRDYRPAEIALPVVEYYYEIKNIAEVGRKQKSYQVELINLKREIKLAKDGADRNIKSEVQRLADITKSIEYMIKVFFGRWIETMEGEAGIEAKKDLKMLLQIAIGRQ